MGRIFETTTAAEGKGRCVIMSKCLDEQVDVCVGISGNTVHW